MDSGNRGLGSSQIQFLKEPLCEFLYRCKVVNFFVEDLWDKVPLGWQEALSHCSIDELCLLPKGLIKEDFPDSLKELILHSQQLSLQREQVTTDFNASKFSTEKIFNTYNLNPKKEHELTAMGQIIKAQCNKLGISWCIDIGSGQGYLSQMLVHQYGINVLALDQSENNIQQSIEIGKKESYVNNKRKGAAKDAEGNGITRGKYVAARMKLTQRTTLAEILKLAVDPQSEEGRSEEVKEGFYGKNFLLTGLHCCGGLSPTVLRMASGQLCQRVTGDEAASPWKMKGLLLLSCCYHLVNEQEDLDMKNHHSAKGNAGPADSVDFPMSNYVSAAGITLGHGARLLACYASDKWPTNPTQRKKLERTHAYRAALQVFLLEHYKDFCSTHNTSIGHVGETHSTTFYDYAKFAITQKLKLPVKEEFTQEFADAFWAPYESKLPTISMFWNLRAVLAPVIESLILIDRQIFLEEQGISTMLIPIFDPAISPRNVAIIAPN